MVAIIVIAPLLLVSCTDRHNIIRTLKRFESKSLFFPRELPVFWNDSIKLETVPEGELFVFYVSPKECSSCQINRMEDNSGILSLGDSLHYSTMFLISPSQTDYEALITYLHTYNPTIPVWIDKNGSFYRKNKHIPDNPSYHLFLLNKERVPIFVGNPMNAGMLQIMKRAMDKSVTVNQ